MLLMFPGADDLAVVAGFFFVVFAGLSYFMKARRIARTVFGLCAAVFLVLCVFLIFDYMKGL